MVRGSICSLNSGQYTSVLKVLDSSLDGCGSAGRFVGLVMGQSCGNIGPAHLAWTVTPDLVIDVLIGSRSFISRLDVGRYMYPRVAEAQV